MTLRDSLDSMFRIYGLFLLLCGAAILLLVLSNLTLARSGGHDLRGGIPFVFFFFVLGIGLMRHHKWAVILFVLCSVGFALWLAIGSVLNVPFPWYLINIGVALFPLVPSVDMVRRWPELTSNNT